MSSTFLCCKKTGILSAEDTNMFERLRTSFSDMDEESQNTQPMRKGAIYFRLPQSVRMLLPSFSLSSETLYFSLRTLRYIFKAESNSSAQFFLTARDNNP